MAQNALICFLKFPQAGNVKTRLAADLQDPQAAANIYELLAERVITEIYPLEGGYDVILYVDPKHDMAQYRAWVGESWTLKAQQGDDLGARLTDAVTSTFAMGYKQVAVIGTDCVGMDQDFIETMFEMLDMNDFIIGPSSDGGYYLLAMREPATWIFENVAWSTESVLETTVDKIEARKLTQMQLEEKIDIDTGEDLAQFREGLPPESYVGKKIDQLILSQMTLEGDPDDILENL